MVHTLAYAPHKNMQILIDKKSYKEKENEAGDEEIRYALFLRELGPLLLICDDVWPTKRPNLHVIHSLSNVSMKLRNSTFND